MRLMAVVTASSRPVCILCAIIEFDHDHPEPEARPSLLKGSGGSGWRAVVENSVGWIRVGQVIEEGTGQSVRVQVQVALRGEGGRVVFNVNANVVGW
jgi:hypothetical protein